MEEMHPSPLKEKEKGKGKASELSAPAPKGRRPRTFYTPAKTLALARCWIDIGEDAIVLNNQWKIGFWTRIAQRYNKEGVKPKVAPYHKASELRKHFEHVMFHINSKITLHKI